MQLDAPRPASVLSRLRAAACVLLAVGIPAASQAQEGTSPKWQLDATTLLYAEASRTRVVEPVARITRLFDGGGSLGLGLALDVITGASPTGARPSDGVQTVTTPSGNTQSVSPGQVPMTPFNDVRGAADLEWQQPIGSVLGATTGGHYSLESDYQSVGLSERLSLETMQRLTTLSIGAGYNHDTVFPIGGTPVGLSAGGELTGVDRNAKQVTSLLAGVSRVLSRRWLIGITATRTDERGYLTEPYKVVSLLDPTTQLPAGHVSELRPSSRQRMDLLGSSVYHLSRDILYISYRYYWDDWGLRSHTVDLKYRAELGGDVFLQPHVRLYTQSDADFFTLGLINGAPLPAYASSDQRLAHFNSVTAGLTYGFHLSGAPGIFAVRAEYFGQFDHLNLDGIAGEDGGGGEPEEEGDDHSGNGVPDAFPMLNVGTVTLSYSISF